MGIYLDICKKSFKVVSCVWTEWCLNWKLYLLCVWPVFKNAVGVIQVEKHKEKVLCILAYTSLGVC